MTTRKIAFITGAARGLGKDTAFAMAKEGWSFYLADILADRLAETASELARDGSEVFHAPLDVTSRDACFAAIADCIARAGRLDCLVNCAGILRFNHATDVTQDEWDKVLSTNLSGPFWLCQAALPHIIATRGNIVNVASSSAVIGSSYLVPYSTSKAGLVQMTRSLAQEYMSEPIRINAILPGFMATEIGANVARQPTMKAEKILRYTGQRGASQASEVAEVIAFLASDRASAINGAVWTADTGTTAG